MSLEQIQAAAHPTPQPHQRWMQDLQSREAGVCHGTRTLGILQAQRQAGSATAYLSKGTRGQKGTTCPTCPDPRAADNPVRTLYLPLALHRKGVGGGGTGGWGRHRDHTRTAKLYAVKLIH